MKYISSDWHDRYSLLKESEEGMKVPRLGIRWKEKIHFSRARDRAILDICDQIAALAFPHVFLYII